MNTTSARAPKSHRRSFTPQEDMLLAHLVSQSPNPNWDYIASVFMNRTARQCREHYRSYLAPNLVNGPWTREEDMSLIQLIQQYGFKWVQISKHFPGRSDSNVKNRWYTHLSGTVNLQQKQPTYSFNSLTEKPRQNNQVNDVAYNEMTDSISSPESETVQNVDESYSLNQVESDPISEIDIFQFEGNDFSFSFIDDSLSLC